MAFPLHFPRTMHIQMGSRIRRLMVSAFTVPTDYPEADGTLSWNKTTLVTVEVHAAEKTGFGYTYADKATAALIKDKFCDLLVGEDAMNVSHHFEFMLQNVRNLGRPGVASMAISAVDSALWDWKAKFFNVPLVTLLGQVKPSISIYGSGGFTSYSLMRLQRQLAGWVEQGIGRVKMKVGSKPDEDVERVRSARAAIGNEAALFVDANGAYSRKQALHFAERFHRYGVSWFEEPVTSDDLEGLRLLRDRVRGGMNVTAGEYGYDLTYFRSMLQAGAVDVLQADATRCCGITGFLKAAALCEAWHVPFSAHTAPSLHLHPCCAVSRSCNLEYFHDHVRIENFLFDGAPIPRNGKLFPDLSRPGLGIELKRADAERYAA